MHFGIWFVVCCGFVLLIWRWCLDYCGGFVGLVFCRFAFSRVVFEVFRFALLSGCLGVAVVDLLFIG